MLISHFTGGDNIDLVPQTVFVMHELSSLLSHQIDSPNAFISFNVFFKLFDKNSNRSVYSCYFSYLSFSCDWPIKI